MRVCVRLLLMSVVVGSFALPAEAADGTRGEIAAGYSYVYDSDASTSFPAGWFFSAGAHIGDMFAVVGDISGNYKSESVTSGMTTGTASVKVHTFLAGPRVIGRSGTVSVFGHVLVGAATASGGVTASGGGASFSVSASETDFCFLPGGGVDVDLNRNTAVRVAANERFIRSSGTTSKEFQLQVGLVYRFRK
jgi:hypothetical protein